jgi:hypothetical protein
VSRLGKLEMAFITGDYARGKDSGIIDLILVGEINAQTLTGYVQKAEKLMHRKIRALVLSPHEFEQNKKSLNPDKALWLWQKDKGIL